MVATRVLALCLMTACYSTPQPDCGFVCGPAGDCPANYQCGSDNRCHRNGTPASLVCSVDAPPMPDAAPRDSIDYDVGPDADVTPPQLVDSTPLNGATGVSRSTTITVGFSEDVVGVDIASFTVAIGASPVTGTVTTGFIPAYYNFTPDSLLMPNATVTVSLSAAIMDLAGNALVPTGFSFDTGN